MALLMFALEIIGAILGFWVAAELIARGTEKLEPVIGQGMSGGVVLGLLGALPETIFVIIALLAGSYDIALGSAIGGNIILFTLGVGVIGIIYATKWKKPMAMKDDYRIELYFLFASTVGLCLLLLYGSLDRVSGAALIALYAIYVGYRYATSHAHIVKHATTAHGKKTVAAAAAFLLAGAVLIVPLSYFFVGIISQFAQAIGISPLWIALVISPIAADLNEGISGYRIAVRSLGGGSTAIVSFVGSKIQNNTMLLGVVGLLAATSVPLGSAVSSLIVIVIVNVVAIAVVMRGRLGRMESALLILAYFVAIAFALGA